MAKICLDAGHAGKYNRCPAIPAYYESEIMWKLTNIQKRLLEALGHTVILTRPDLNTDKEVYARGQMAKGCDLFISNHSNAVGAGADANGMNENTDYPVVYVPLNGKSDAIGKQFADAIRNVMGTKQAGRIATREGNNGDYYGVIRGAVAAGCPLVMLPEHSFHTNSASVNWLLKDANLEKLAAAEIEVVKQFLKGGVTPLSPPQTTNTLYRVRKSWADANSQVGAYKDLDNARAEAYKRKAEGYKVFDVAGVMVYDPNQITTTTPVSEEYADPTTGLNFWTSAGVISSPDYWKGKAKETAWLGTLINKTAEYARNK